MSQLALELKAQQEIEALRAEIEALKQQVEQGKRDAVPEGWVAVPKEPTYNMLKVMTGLNISIAAYRVATLIRYRAMIAAAPKQEK